MISWVECITSVEIGLIYGIVAIGIFLTFRVIDFPDLTCDGSFVAGAAASAVAIKAGFSPPIALVFALLMGGCAGCLTGLLHHYFKVTDLLSGILVAFMFYSINLKIMGGTPNIALINDPTIFSISSMSPLLILIILATIICLCISYLLVTDFGLALRSIGQNKKLAAVSGISIPFFTYVGLTISNALIGFSGGLFSQHQSFVDVSQGIGTIIIGLAAVLIGEKILPFRSMWLVVASCILGSIIYRLIVAFALHSEWLGLETQDLNLITGILVIIIMLLPKFNLKKPSMPLRPNNKPGQIQSPEDVCRD